MKKNEGEKILLDLAANVPNFVKKHGWVARYDPESDELSIAKPHLSPTARIRYADDEVAFYITPQNRVEGIFIEYFQSNFMRHHKDLKQLARALEAKKDSNSLIELEDKNVQQIGPDLEETLRSILAQRLDLNFSKLLR